MVEGEGIEIVVYLPLDPKPEPRLKRRIMQGKDEHE